MNYLPVQKFPLLLCMVFVFSLCQCGPAANDNGQNDSGEANNSVKQTAMPLPPEAQDNALPFTIEFVEKNYSADTLPRLQSYAFAVTRSGNWLIVGGRRQGLHTFQSAPAKNFIPDSSNNFIFIINPTTGTYVSYDVNRLPAALAAPLQATNQQYYYDKNTDQLYLIGGYGWNAAKTDMLTFNTIIRFGVDAMVKAIVNNETDAQIASLLQSAQDDRFAVTGGDLFKLNNNFYLVFGQRFDGQYRAFGGNTFTQNYTEEVRIFNLLPNSVKINSYGANTNTTGDRPFHRRDGNLVNDINPATGLPRITAFGGVFKPGIIAPYTYPVYITGPSAPVVDTTGQQNFSQYSCPVISVYDSAAADKTVYHTFFGGIGHYYYRQTGSQKGVYDSATQQGRNDGFPFVQDVSTFQQSASNNYKEFIQVNPIPGNRLLGASIPFIPNTSLVQQGYAYDNDVIKLAAIPQGKRVLAGYIYGGIEAENPLPRIPNTGTFVSNSVFEVYITHTPAAAIPASFAHESAKSDSNLHRK